MYLQTDNSFQSLTRDEVLSTDGSNLGKIFWSNGKLRCTACTHMHVMTVAHPCLASQKNLENPQRQGHINEDSERLFGFFHIPSLEYIELFWEMDAAESLHLVTIKQLWPLPDAVGIIHGYVHP